MHDYQKNDGIVTFCAVLSSFEPPAHRDLVSTCCYALGWLAKRDRESDEEYWRSENENLRRRLLALVNEQKLEEEFLIRSLVDWVVGRYCSETDPENSRLSLSFEKQFLAWVKRELTMPVGQRSNTDEALRRMQRNTEKRIAEWDQRIEEKKDLLRRFRDAASAAYPARYWDFYSSWKAQSQESEESQGK